MVIRSKTNLSIQNIFPVRICGVVTGITTHEFIERLKTIQEQAAMVEIRADYIRNITPHDLTEIKKYLTKPAIFTCRRKSNYNKGNYTGSLSSQLALYQKANDLGIDYLDIEYREYDNLLIKNKKSKIIISYHDWEKTGNYKELTDIINNMRTKKEDIIKFASMVHTLNDSNNLMKILLNKKPSEKMIVIGMGEKAMFTRALAPLLGSFLTFASVEESYSAPGQLDIKSLKMIYNLLGYNIDES